MYINVTRNTSPGTLYFRDINIYIPYTATVAVLWEVLGSRRE
jgi:hypothetical protein